MVNAHVNTKSPALRVTFVKTKKILAFVSQEKIVMRTISVSIIWFVSVIAAFQSQNVRMKTGVYLDRYVNTTYAFQNQENAQNTRIVVQVYFVTTVIVRIVCTTFIALKDNIVAQSGAEKLSAQMVSNAIGLDGDVRKMCV